jgi:hypothetical protein
METDLATPSKFWESIIKTIGETGVVAIFAGICIILLILVQFFSYFQLFILALAAAIAGGYYMRHKMIRT